MLNTKAQETKFNFIFVTHQVPLKKCLEFLSIFQPLKKNQNCLLKRWEIQCFILVNSCYFCLIIYTILSKIPYNVLDHRSYARLLECISETYEGSSLPGLVHYQKL